MEKEIQRQLNFQPESMGVVVRMVDGVEKKFLTGKAIVYDQFKEIWPNYFEKVDKDALRDADVSDVKININHTNGFHLLGRTKSGTAKIWSTDTHAHFEVEVPETEGGKFAAVMVQRGDLAGCSFHASFKEKDVEIRREGTERVYVTLKRFMKVKDMSIVEDPAYTDTSVGVIKRDMEGFMPVVEAPESHWRKNNLKRRQELNY